jgi:peptide/nickel transport system permease protein
MTTAQIAGAQRVDETSSAPAAAVADSKIGEISQTRLMYRRFKQSKLAIVSLIILALLYLSALFAPFLAPNDPTAVDQEFKYAAPSSLTWSGGPAMCTVKQEIDPINISTTYVKDCSNPIHLQLFGKGFEYKVLGLIPADRHLLVAPEGAAKVLLFGGDGDGRDIFARTFYGGRVSLTIGVLGVVIATILGSIIGTWSGYAGGKTDNVIQRVIEVIMSIPTLPLWATMAGVLSQDLSVTKRYFLMTLILSLVTWTGLARQLRGKVMGYASSDYVAAARTAGAKSGRIIISHLLPNSASHIVVVSMLAIPATIIAETTLSFLGIGMLDPAISWGVLLKDASRSSIRGCSSRPPS